MPTFTPPARTAVPPILPRDGTDQLPLARRLMRHYRSRPEGISVFILSNGTVQEEYPDSERVFWTQGDGTPYVTNALYGGHDNYIITDSEAALLVANGYTVAQTDPPTITSIAPSSGVAATAVIITGTALTGATVTVDGVAVTAVATATTVTFTTPAHADGAVNVVVTTVFGVAQTSFTYATPAVNAPPAINALSPTSGVAGATVILTGTTFTNVTTVTFDGVSATFTINSATQITATAPTHTDGATSVVATDANGASNARTFTYATPAAPNITAVSPTSGVATTVITLTGTTLATTTSVTVDGVSVSFVATATTITFTAPIHIDGVATIVVTTPAGTDSDTFTYATPAPQNPPVLTSLTPSSGGTAGGTSVVIAGTSMDLTTSVTFAGVPVSFTINSPTQVTATAPAHAAGSVSVLCNSVNGPSNSLSYVYADADPHPGNDVLLEDNSFLLLEDGSSSLQQES